MATTVITQNIANFESADLSLTKAVSNSSPNVGDQITYTVIVTNSGPSAASGVAVSEPLTPGVTLVSSNPSQGVYANGIWNVGNLSATAGTNTATLTIVAQVNSIDPQINTAQVSASDQSDPDSTPGNNVAEDDQASITVTARSIDLSLIKEVSTDSPNIGDSIAFTIDIRNDGLDTATGVTVRDVLPAGLSFTNATTSNGTPYNSGTGIWDVGSLGSNQTARLTINATVTANGARTNVAEVVTANEQDTDSTPGNNDPNEDDQDLAQFSSSQADLSLTKDANTSSPNVGENVVFTVALQNSGPDTATNVSVTDLLPNGLRFISSDQPASYNAVTGIWTVGSVPQGAQPTLNITAQVESQGSITNIAQVRTSDQNDPDSTPNNNADEDDQEAVTLTPAVANLSLEKTSSTDSPNLNEQFTFTITVNNAGPNAATNVRVLDQLPSGVQFVSSSSTDFNANTGVWEVGTIGAGGSRQLVLTVLSQTSGIAINSAQIIASDQFDPNSTPNNNDPNEDDQDSAQIESQQIDLSLTKAVDNNRPNVGDQITFEIIVSNAGPSIATGVQVAESLPAGVTLVSSLPSVGSFDTNTGIWTVGTLGVNQQQTLILTARVDSVLTDASNTAQVSAADQNDFDSTPNNNADEDDQASVSFSTPIADLSLTKGVDIASPNVGDTITFTVMVQNDGPDNATGVIVTDMLPSGFRFISNNISTGTYNPSTGIWNVGNLNNGSTATLDLIGEVLASGEMTNTAQVTASDQADLDSTPANNVSGEDDQASIGFTPQQIDLSLTKATSEERPAIGESFSFTLAVMNNGPDTATGVQVTDVLPAGINFVSSTPAGAFNPGTGIWTVGSIASGNTASLDIVVTATTPGTKLNSAEVTAADQADIDSVPGNNVSMEDDQASISVTPASADLSLTKIVDNRDPNVGDQVTFNITVSNAGPDAASNITVSDVLPAGLSFVSSSTATGAYNSGTGIWSIPTLGASGSAILVIQATVDTTGQVVNTAEIISSSQADPDSTPGNNDPNEDDQASVPLAPQLVDLALTKMLDNSNPNVGDTIAYTLELTNEGPSTATGVQVTDLLPNGITFASAVPSVGTYNPSSGVWEIGNVAPGTTPSLVIRSTVGETRGVSNTAEVTAVDQPDSDSTPGNGVEGEDDQATIPFTTQVADLSLTKDVLNASPGRNDNVNFLLTLSNAGPNPATEVVVNDLLPSGLRFVSANPSVGVYDPATGLWSVPNLPVGATATLQIASAVTSAVGAINTAQIQSSLQFDPDSTPGNNVEGEDDIDSADFTPQVVDISVSAMVDNAEPLEGETIQVVFTTTNGGPDTASNLSLQALLPAGLSLLSSQPQTGTFNSVTGEWAVGNLAAGASTQLVLNVQVISRGIRTIPIEVISTDQFDLDSTPDNGILDEDDQAELLIRAPRLLTKRLFFSR